MENNIIASTKKQLNLSKDSTVKFVGSAFLAAFWVVFIWNFWSKDVYALGFNAFVFFLIFLGLFIWVLYKKERYTHYDLIWIIPFVLAGLSYALYDNPFLKAINFLVLPISFAVFYNQAFLSDKKTKSWNFEFIFKIIKRIFSFLTKIKKSVGAYLNLILPKEETKTRVIIRAAGGVILFLIVAFTIFIPLLSSADAVFADKTQFMLDWFRDIVSPPLMYKLLTFVVLSVLFFSLQDAWSARFDYESKEEDGKNIDSIISGIVLGGILCLYLLFLWVQINRLWVGELPFDFKETENLVKSGFWQLLFLSIINIVIYFFTYKKTVKLVQQFLIGFTAASLLLLVSAGYRMGLYVTYYGFSYEKFFATYAVIFCAILFIWLISRLFTEKRANIVKFLAILFLWMYSVALIFPVEQFILRANVSLARLKESKIRLFEMTMLSPDVLCAVKKYEGQGALKENAGYLARENEKKQEENFNWSPWIIRQEKIVLDKKWYEKNLMNVLCGNKYE